MRVLFLLSLTCFVFLGSSCSTSPSGRGNTAAEDDKEILQFQTIVSSRLDKNGAPVEDTNTVGRAAGRVYLVTKWFEISAGEKQYACELYDGTGQLVWKDKSVFTPQDGGWVTSSWYSFRNVDRAGAWKFRVLLNGQAVVERPFALLDGDARPDSGRLEF